MTVSRNELSVESLLALAERDSGGHGLADTGLLVRFKQLIDWINARGPYSAAQLDGMRHQLQQLLANRLRIALDRRRHPAIADERIQRPIFVVGFARSGTTLLHSLLAEDPLMQTPRVWHSRFPSPPPGETPVCEGRLAFATRSIQQLIDFVPSVLPLHPYWDKGADALVEDDELFTLDFRNAYPTLLYRTPTLEVMTDIGGGDVLGSYRFHRQFLQHLQWNTGKHHWACKGAGHQFLLDTLFEVYPDALCVWPHRSLVEIHVSTVTIASVLYDAINGGRIDWKQYARTSAEALKAGLDRVMASPLINDPRVLHTTFKEICTDPVAVVRKVYERAGLPVTSEHNKRMRTWIADPANKLDRYGRYPYSHEAFGINEAWVRELFADYGKRFGVN